MRPRGPVISQLLVAFCAFAVLIAVAAVVGYAGLAHQNSATKELTGRDYVLEQAAGQMQQDFTISQLAISSFALSGHPGDLGPLPAAQAAFTARLGTLRAHAPQNLRGFVDTQASTGEQLFAVGDEMTGVPAGSPVLRVLAERANALASTKNAATHATEAILAGQVQHLSA